MTTLSQNPWKSLLLIILFVIAGFFIGQFLAIVVVSLGFGIPFSTFETWYQSALSDPQNKVPIILLQGIVALGTFVLGPYLFLRRGGKAQILFQQKNRPVIGLFVVLLLTFCFMNVNAYVIEWNESLQFPEFMDGFRRFAENMQDSADEMTTFLTQINSVGYFSLAFIVMAIIPGIGEELLFRGLIQPNLHKITNNIHVAIWLTAFIFSAVHFQFYGFFPRMLLGALFGYLYVWSKNIWVPILAHFFNNGFTLLMVYLYQINIISVDIDESSLPLGLGLIFAVSTIVLLIVFKRWAQANGSSSSSVV